MEAREPWSLWVDGPDRTRAEFGAGAERVTVIIEGSRWWSFSAWAGAQTNDGDPHSSHGPGPGECLLHSARILADVELELVGESHVLNRRALVVAARPVSGDTAKLEGLGWGADEYELLVDAERGVLLRSEARVGGYPWRVLEMEEVAFDEDFPPGTFTLDPPPRESFEVRETPRYVTLDELQEAVAFTVLVPKHAPSTDVDAMIFPAWQRHKVPLPVTIGYTMEEAAGPANLWIRESASPMPEDPRVMWRGEGEAMIGESSFDDRSRVQLQLQGSIFSSRRRP